MDIDNMTIGDFKQLAAMFSGQQSCGLKNPFIGQRVLVRTYSAGVHIGTLVSASETECHLKDALRLWKWEGGGLSLSAVAENGIVKGRLNLRRCKALSTPKNSLNCPAYPTAHGVNA